MDGDPYPHIKKLIEGELEQVTSLQGAVFTGQHNAIQSVSRGLQSVEEQLGALEDAVKHMVEDPARFGLRPSTAYQRQVEVENLRFQTTELQRSFDGVTTPTAGSDARRPKASTSLPTSSRRAAPHDDVHGLDQADAAIQLTLQRQDDELEHISLHVEQIKGVSHSIHEELEMQARLLDNMNEDVDRQHLHVRALKRRVTEIIKKSSGNSQLILIGCLVLVLIILTVIAFN